MHPHQAQAGDPTHSPPMPSVDDMADRLESFAAEADQRARQRFDEIMLGLARRLLDDEASAREAVESGGFLLEGVTVVVRFNEEMQQIDLFCDIGLPQPHEQAQVYRAALEHNLCRTYPGFMLGVHPESDRLVATTALHLLLVADEEVCLGAIQVMVDMARQLRVDLRLPDD